MAAYACVMGYSKVVILCCVVLFGASPTSAGRTSRRFVGLPESGLRVTNNNARENSRTVIVRHDFPGRIIFHESKEFWIELVTTTPEGQNHSNVKALYTSIDNNTISLQVYKPTSAEPEETSETENILNIIISSVGAFVLLGLVTSALCYYCYWKRRQMTKTKQDTKEIHEGNPTPGVGRCNLGFQGSAPPGTSGVSQLMVVAVCACALHAQLQTVNVEINIYFPSGFLRPDTRVFLNSKNNNEIRVITNDTNLNIGVFDVTDAGLVLANHCSGRNLTCVNGACDPVAGKCVCPRKMRVNRKAGGLIRCVYRCDERCPTGSFELSPCNHTHPAVCKKCRPLCSFKEFESSPCAGKTDRNCTDISKLPRIKVSSNIVHEDVLKVKDDPPVTQTIASPSNHASTWLNRSSGLAIRMQMLHVDFSMTFQEVKHDVNDNKKLPQSASSILRYCNSPVPEFYEINLQREGKKVRYIKGHPDRTCPSYDGISERIRNVQGNLLSCNGAENPVVRLFGENSEPEDFLKEDRSRQCYDYKQNCNKCRDKCVTIVRENPICNLTETDVTRDGRQDFGEHFGYCFDCCFQENCTCSSCACSLYNALCIDSQLTCVETEGFSIPINPVFPSLGKFKCHVELSRGPVFEMETTLWKDGKMLKRIENNDRNKSQEDVNEHDYGYMVLKHPSVLRNGVTKMIMISGQAGKTNFDVGWYETEQELKPSSATQKLSIQPKEPFKINSNDWAHENCLNFDTERFITISSSKPINNFKKFSKLSASITYLQNTRVYKVYNNSGPRQVHVELPQGRSVLRYTFPETVIFNDRSFTGQLLKNRTFWTIRFTGRVTSCPGFFVVRLTDQDRPEVDVYHYDIAIKNEDCSFLIEFNLPSGGDTNMIDKQFVVRLTDSRKTMKLILISPRRIPEFEIPDLDDDFDLKKLEVLIPFGGAAGGMLIVLVAILIYGYKTRPKDSYQRDRDNQLHFRHLLFVVWFVGMRLVKSFLLTLTVFSVILTGIHYTNVRTLQGYKTFHEHQKSLEEDFIKQMDAHKVQEITRQWELVGEGKLICNRKLDALNAYLEKHFKEMKEKQQEEMKIKSILRAASRRIEKQFKAAKAKFEKERIRLNAQMKAYSWEINSRLSRIQDKIENHNWLKAARGMHTAFRKIAKFFGKSMKPFIRWVGLSVSFPSINLEMPSFDDLFNNVNFKLDSSNSSDSNSGSSFWHQHFTVITKINIQQVTVPELNISTPVNKDRAKELLALEWIIQSYRSGVFTKILILLDILWFVYRHSKTYQLAILLFHGFPKLYELEKIHEDEEKKQRKLKKKEEKLKKRAEKKARKETEERNLFDSIEDLQEASENELETIQEEEVEEEETINEEKNRKEEYEMKRMIRNDAEKDECKSLDSSAKDIEDLQEEVSNIKAGRFGKTVEDQKENTKQNKTIMSAETRGNKGQEENEDSKNIGESLNDEESNQEDLKKKVIAGGLKGVDSLNTVLAKIFAKLKELNYQINNTNLVPMCVLSVIAILSVYVVIVTAKHSMNVDTLDDIGYFDLKMTPLLTMRKIVNTRITSNAFMLNEIHIPYYENRVNDRIAFYRKKAEMYQAYQCAKADLHNEEYCFWVEEPGVICEGVNPYNQDFLSNLTQFECNLEPVLPQRFTKFDRVLYKEVHKKAIAPYVAALRGLILNTFDMFLILIAIFILLKILGMVVFVLLKKFDLVRQVKHYKVSQELKKEIDKAARTTPHCLKYRLSTKTDGRAIRPLKFTESMKGRFGSLVNKGKCSHWVDEHDN